MTIKYFKKGFDPRRHLTGKKTLRTALCREIFQEFMLEEVEYQDGTTGKQTKTERARLLLLALFNEAMNGDVQAIKVFLDRTVGPVAVAVSNPDGSPILPPMEELLRRVQELRAQELKEQSNNGNGGEDDDESNS